MITLTLFDLEYETSVSIWEFENTQFKLSLLMNYDTLICLRILVFPIGIIEDSTSRKCCF